MARLLREILARGECVEASAEYQKADDDAGECEVVLRSAHRLGEHILCVVSMTNSKESGPEAFQTDYIGVRVIFMSENMRIVFECHRSDVMCEHVLRDESGQP